MTMYFQRAENSGEFRKSLAGLFICIITKLPVSCTCTFFRPSLQNISDDLEIDWKILQNTLTYGSYLGLPATAA